MLSENMSSSRPRRNDIERQTISRPSINITKLAEDVVVNIHPLAGSSSRRVKGSNMISPSSRFYSYIRS